MTYPCSPDSSEAQSLGASYGGTAGVVTATIMAGAGGASSFGGVVANGATANGIQCVGRGGGCCYNTGRDCNNVTCAPIMNVILGNGRIRGAEYGVSYQNGTAGYTVVGVNGVSHGTFGGGGGGGGDHNSDTVCPITGSSGYVATSTITVTPGQVLTATVGGGGAGYDWWANYAYAGAAGCIFVEYGNGVS